ncbi:hypothetical protein P171DRAFT_73338 [Karstenula rhodostoma CBS 690.94]|uniref:Uncharacterized protein n=1 Tax=Karstenula rhodostoma CBS 690.94 TaxID=1392251 RepID=A0A9P4U9X2_9PLEO|nr:hypothetical protein P171DRAFT_73338 [Karstenula rhodostoma CBS 690.94]
MTLSPALPSNTNLNPDSQSPHNHNTSSERSTLSTKHELHSVTPTCAFNPTYPKRQRPNTILLQPHIQPQNNQTAPTLGLCPPF